MIYPNNRMIVDGVDLTSEFGLILCDGYDLGIPEAKTYTVDIPGGDGVVDLTQSLSGDVVYNNREQIFDFYALDLSDFQKYRTKLLNFLQGKEHSYKLTFDPEYTWKGRFKVSNAAHSARYANNSKVGYISITVDAEPYKSKGMMEVTTCPDGGVVTIIENGRRRSQPIFTFRTNMTVIYKDAIYNVTPGSYKFNDIWLEEGTNSIFLASELYNNMPFSYKYSDLANHTYDNISKNNAIFEWYKIEQPDIDYSIASYFSYSDKTYAEVTYKENMTELILQHIVPINTYLDLAYLYNQAKVLATINYEWRDL